MLELRKMTAKTARLALPLLEAQYREHDIDMRGPKLARALRRLLPGNGAVFVALEPRRAGRPAPVGLALLSYQITVEKGGRVAWLEELYVVPERRDRGLGRKLLLRAIAEARRAGCVAVELEVVEGHDRAARLYRRERFDRVPRTRYTRDL